MVGCRTLSLNQKGETIKRSDIEISGTADLGVGVINTLNWITYFYTSSGMQFRYGITENMEFQFKMNLYIDMPFFGLDKSSYYPGGEYYYENSFKFRTFKGNNSNLSILPYFGYTLGVDYTKLLYYGPSFGLTTGLKIIGDYKDFYYGFPIGIKYYPFIQSIYRVPIEVETGFSFGVEYNYREKLIVRNEFSLMVGFIKVTPDTFSITAAYSLSVGKRFPKKKLQ